MRSVSSKDYHRFVDAPPEAGFTSYEIAAAYGVTRTALTNWGLKRISKVGKHHIYRKSDVIRQHGEPTNPPRRTRRWKVKPKGGNGNGYEVPSLGERAVKPAEVLYPVDVRRVQAAFRKELECALAPVLTILDRHSEALFRLVQIEERQLEMWKPGKAA